MSSRDSQNDAADYEVLAPLSSGTYGENLLAVRRDRFGVGKLVVLRQIRRGLSADKRVREAFLDIGRRAVRLSHTNLVQTFELGERGGALFAATEHLEGEPLDAIMAAIAPAPHAVDARFWLLIACDALSGLQYAHDMRDFDGSELGLVHGGVTPRKIFVTYSGRVVVTDFGLAALAAHAKRLEGTYLPEMVSYAAPEQREGRPCDARVDVYAIGIILWELLSGRRHRQTNDPHADLEPLPPLEEIKPDIDRALADVVMRAIAPDPDDRWQNAVDLRMALEPFVDRGGVVRRGALGEAIALLFARSREKIPMLLSKRTAPLAPQDVYAVTLAGAPKTPSKAAPELEEEEAPFLLAQPIEAVSEANVISVTELVSDSELLSHAELVSAADLAASGPTSSVKDPPPPASGPAPSVKDILPSADSVEADIESIPDSATPLSLSQIEIPVDETSTRSVNTLKTAELSAALRDSAHPPKGGDKAEEAPAASSEHPTARGPDSGERPTLTDTGAVPSERAPEPKDADEP